MCTHSITAVAYANIEYIGKDFLLAANSDLSALEAGAIDFVDFWCTTGGINLNTDWGLCTDKQNGVLQLYNAYKIVTPTQITNP